MEWYLQQGARVALTVGEITEVGMASGGLYGVYKNILLW